MCGPWDRAAMRFDRLRERVDDSLTGLQSFRRQTIAARPSDALAARPPG
jgi:hypothetical protein